VGRPGLASAVGEIPRAFGDVRGVTLLEPIRYLVEAGASVGGGLGRFARAVSIADRMHADRVGTLITGFAGRADAHARIAARMAGVRIVEVRADAVGRGARGESRS